MLHVKKTASGNLLYDARSSNLVLCDNLGWEVGGRFKREGTYVDLLLIHVVVWLKQHCKAIILQLKKYLMVQIKKKKAFSGL